MNKYIIRNIASLLIIATLYTGSTIPTNLQTQPIRLARGGFRGGGFGHGGFNRGGFRHREGFKQQRWHHRRPVNGRRDHQYLRNNRYYGGNVFGVAIDGGDDDYYGAAVGTAAAATLQQKENESLRQHVRDLQSQIEELQQARESEDDD